MTLNCVLLVADPFGVVTFQLARPAPAFGTRTLILVERSTLNVAGYVDDPRTSAT